MITVIVFAVEIANVTCDVITESFISRFQTCNSFVRAGHTRCQFLILVFDPIETSTAGEPIRWIQTSTTSDVEDQRHSFQGVHLLVAVDQPSTGIVRPESDDRVAPRRNDHRVLDRRIDQVDRRPTIVAPTGQSAQSVTGARYVRVVAGPQSSG